MFEYSNRYCEWKDNGIIDSDYKTPSHEYITDCKEKVIATPNNKYGKLIKGAGTHCPFCKKEIDIRCYS